MTKAEQDLGAILRAIPRPEKLREANEARTRMAVIDRILGACGWTEEHIHPEHPTGTGDFIDYLLAKTPDDPWMVVEAKRVNRTFSVEKTKSSHRSLASLHKQGRDIREVLDQAATYCNARAVPYAAITNGYQWLFFRGLSAPGYPWTKGSALVFHSIDDMLARIGDFRRCLHRGHAYTPELPALLQHSSTAGALAGRCATDLVPNLTRPPATPRPDIRAVLDHLFTEIFGTDRDGMLDSCYVTPGYASDFDSTLQRLLNDKPDELTSGGDDTRDGTPAKFVSDLAADARYLTIHHPIAIVGNVGAGKTTFLRRVLVDLVRTNSVITAYINLEGRSSGGTFHQPDEANHFATELIKDLAKRTKILIDSRSDISNKEMSQAEPDSPETLGTIFRARVDSEWKLSQALWKRQPDEWDRRRLSIFDEERRDKFGYLLAYIRHLKARIPPSEFTEGQRKRIPLVIFVDNLDLCTDDFQRFIYGVCAQLTSETGAITVLCLREDTYRVGRRAGGFLTSSQLQYIFHVASPPLDRVLRLRIEYAQAARHRHRLPAHLDSAPSSVESTIYAAKGVFQPSELPTEATGLIASLSGHDVRESLRLVRAVLQAIAERSIAPKPTSECVFECLSAQFGSRIGSTRPGVFVVLESPPWTHPMHALPCRLLAYYERAYEHPQKAFLEPSERAITDFAAWGYPITAVRETLLSLLQFNMLRSPGLTEVESWQATMIPQRLTLTASGHAHLTQATRIDWYRALSGLHMRWYSESALLEFAERSIHAGGANGVTIGDIAVSGALQVLDAYLAESVAKEDSMLSEAISRTEWARAVLARSALLASPARGPQPPATDTTRRLPQQAASPANRPRTKAKPEADQLGLFPAAPLAPGSSPAVAMPPIARDSDYLGSTFLARILWALTLAEREQMRPLSATDISRVLDTYGGIDIPATNVARAFRELPVKRRVYWKCDGQRYVLTDAGRLAFAAAFGATS